MSIREMNFYFSPYLQNRYPDLPTPRFIEKIDSEENITSQLQSGRATYSPILRDPSPNTLLEQMKRDQRLLLEILVKLENPGHFNEAQTSFKKLPASIRNTLYFWTWVKYGIPDNIEEGKKYIFDHLHCLLKINDPYISISGKNIVEQMILSLDEKIQILKIKKMAAAVGQMQKIYSSSISSNDAFNTLLEDLPSDFKNSLQEHVSLFLKGPAKLDQKHQALFRIQQACLTKMAHQISSHEKDMKTRYEMLWSSPSFPYSPLKELYDQLSPEFRLRVRYPTDAIDPEKKVFPRLNRYALYTELGAHPTLSGTKFCTYAPHAKNVSVAITYKGDIVKIVPMTFSEENGTWHAEIEGVKPGTTYMYEIISKNDQKFLKLDPFSFKNFQYPNGFHAIVSDLEDYSWSDSEWMKTRSKFSERDCPVSIYEVHLPSWLKNNQGKLNYKQLALELSRYCKVMGFTHLEIFGLLDHSYEGSWGYQPLSFFAPNHRLFSPEKNWSSVQEFKEFIDEMHKEGIGVILDWIPGHFDQNKMGLRDFDGANLYEYQDHREEWGATLFDYSNEYVRNYLLSSAFFWLHNMHLDGIRLDALNTILERSPYGDERPAKKFMSDLTELAKKQFPGSLMIAECWRNNGITAPIESGGLGFDLKWTSGSNQIFNFMKQSFKDRKGRLSEITDAPFQDGDERLIWHTDHDKSRQSTGSLYHQMPGTHFQKLANVRLMISYFMTLPGKKMIFMGDELAQVQDWDSRMRKGMKEDPSTPSVEWMLQKDPGHQGVQAMVQKLNFLYRSLPELCHEGNETKLRWIDIKDTTNNVVSFHRGNLACVCNFSPNSYDEYDIYFPEHEIKTDRIKAMKEIFNSDAKEFGGYGKTNAKVTLIKKNGSIIGFRVRMPPLAMMIFKEDY